MFIAHLRFTVSPDTREIAIGALLSNVDTVRRMTGCIAFVPFIDVDRPGGLGVIHEWQSEGDFANYTASEAFRELGASLRPMMTAPPESKRFHAEPQEVVR